MAKMTIPKNEAERTALYQAGFGDTEIGKLMGASHRAIWKWRMQRGLPSNKPRGTEIRPDKDIQRMADYTAGLNDAELSQRWGILRDRVLMGASAASCRLTAK
jgi:hypothetical protein